jgi:hypothetical protein
VANRRGREEAGDTQGQRNMVALDEESNGGGLARPAPYLGWVWGHGGNHSDPKEQR